MSSENRISANRANSRFSTGPRTDQGKRRSSMNALKHGLTAKTDVIPGDPYRSYKSYRRKLLAELNPFSFLDHELADRIIGDLWRLKRIPKLESSIMREMRTRKNEPALALADLALAVASKSRNFTNTCDSGESFIRGPGSRNLGAEAVAEAQEVSSLTSVPPVLKSPRARYCTNSRVLSSLTSPQSTGWLDYSEHFARFSRYEATLERSIFRSLNEYRRLHAESTPNPAPKLPSRQPPSNSSNPHRHNDIRRPLYCKGLASFRKTVCVPKGTNRKFVSGVRAALYSPMHRVESLLHMVFDREGARRMMMKPQQTAHVGRSEVRPHFSNGRLAESSESGKFRRDKRPGLER